MARKAKYDWGKTRSSKYQKFETRVMNKFTVSANDQDSVYIDVAQNLSLINRKLVRQGHVFSISDLRFWAVDNDADDMAITVSALPRTWMMFNAYKKARSLWNQMNLEALDGLGQGNLPKYYDFKVLFDAEHFRNHILQQGSNDSGNVDLHDNLLPCDGDGNVIDATGDWVYSKFQTSESESDVFYAHMCGKHQAADGSDEGASGRDMPNNGGSAGLILAYQQSRGASFTDQDITGLDQQVDIDSPWAMLFGADDQSQETMEALDVDNDAPPYGADYVGGVTLGEGVYVGGTYVSGSEAGTPSRSLIRTFEAPMGLIKLDLNRDSVTGDASNIFCSYEAKIIGAC